MRREIDKPHKKLNVWKKAIDLVLMIYNVSQEFPEEEKFSLTSQIRRSAISISANIAEGAARHTKKEFVNFLHIAQASLSELDTHLEISKRLNYISDKDYNEINLIMSEIDKIISGLIKYQWKNKI